MHRCGGHAPEGLERELAVILAADTTGYSALVHADFEVIRDLGASEGLCRAGCKRLRRKQPVLESSARRHVAGTHVGCGVPVKATEDTGAMTMQDELTPIEQTPLPAMQAGTAGGRSAEGGRNADQPHAISRRAR
jgi:hypothetical protein